MSTREVNVRFTIESREYQQRLRDIKSRSAELNQQFSELTGGTGRLTAEQRQAWSAFERTQRAMGGVDAAAVRLSRQQRDLNQSLERGVITQRDYDRAMQRLEQSAAGAGQSQRRLRDQMSDTQSQTNRLGSAVSGAAKKFLALAAAYVSIRALKGAFSGIIQEAEQLERNLLRTEAVLAATGGTVGFAVKELHEQARQLALGTLQSTEGVMRAQQVLMTFRTVSGDTFSRATELAADLATVTGGNLTSAMTQLGKALEDPVRGITALRRSGVSFTESQKETIKSLVETNRQAEAQTLILDELSRQYGGVAKREAEGYSGAVDTLGQRMQELQLKIGEVSGALEWMTERTNDAAKAVHVLSELADGVSFDRAIARAYGTINEVNAPEHIIKQMDKVRALRQEAAKLQKEIDGIGDRGIVGDMFGQSLPALESALARVRAELNQQKAVLDASMEAHVRHAKETRENAAAQREFEDSADRVFQVMDAFNGDADAWTKSMISATAETLNWSSGVESATQRLSQSSDIVRSAAEKFKIPEEVVLSVFAMENAFGRMATSVAGAKGPMQFMDATAAGVAKQMNAAGVATGMTASKIQGELTSSIEAGAFHLADLLKQFGSFHDALVAYNAGPGRVGLKFAELPKETQEYVRNGIALIREYANATGNAGAFSTKLAEAEAYMAGEVKKSSQEVKDAAREADAYAKAHLKAASTLRAGADGVEDYLQGLREEVRLSQLSASEKRAMRVEIDLTSKARAAEAKAIEAAAAGNTKLSDSLLKVAEGYRGAIPEAQELVSQLDQAGPKIETFASLWKGAIESISSDIQGKLADAFESLFSGSLDSAKDFFKSLGDIFKRSLAQLAASVVQNKIVIPIMASMIPGAAGAAGLFGGGGGGLTGDAGTSVLGGGGFGGIGNMFGGNSMGTGIANTLTTAAGKLGMSAQWIGDAASNLASTSNLAMGAGGFAGGMASKMLFDFDSQAESIGHTVGSTAGTVIGTAIGGPIGAALGSFLGGSGGGFLGGMFGGSGPKMRAGVQGGEIYMGDNKGIEGEVLQKFQQAAEEVNAAMLNTAKMLGPAAMDALQNYNMSGKHGPGSVSQIQDDPEAFLQRAAAGMADVMIDAVVEEVGGAGDFFKGMIEDLRHATAGDIQAFVAGFVDLNQAIQAFEPIIKTITGETEVAVDTLARTVDSFASMGIGGGDAQALMNSYYQNFYSEEERRLAYVDKLQKQMTSDFEELDVAIPKTKTEFRNLVESLDLTTEEGNRLFASLMAVAPAFSELADQGGMAAKEIMDVAARLTANTGELGNGIRGLLNDVVYEGLDAGPAFAEMIEQYIVGTLLDSISQMIYESVVKQLMDSAVQSATSLATGGAMGGTAIKLGAEEGAIDLAAIVDKAKVQIDIMGQVLADEGFQAAIKEIGKLINTIGDQISGPPAPTQSYTYARADRRNAEEDRAKEARQEADKAAEEAAKRLADQRALDVKILRAQGLELEATTLEREYELEAMADGQSHLIERTKQLWAAEDAYERETDLRSIGLKILRAEGKEFEAVQLERDHELEVLKNTKPYLVDLTKELWALQDAAELKAKSDELHVELLRAIGDEQAAVDFEREQELESLRQLDPALAEAKQRIYDLVDAANALGGVDIAALYQDLFNRPADSSGIQSWVAEGFTNPAAAEKAMLAAADRSDLERTVSAAYEVLFNRVADPSGLAHYVEQLAGGAITSVADLHDIMMAGANDADLAAQALGESLDFSDILGAYQSTLGRTADAAGIGYWLAQELTDPAELEAGIREGAQGDDLNHLIDQAFQELFGHYGDASGRAHWAEQWASGVFETWDDLLQAMVGGASGEDLERISNPYFEQQQGLEIDLLRAQGEEQAALNAERAIALQQMPAQLRALQEQVWAAEEARMIAEKRTGLEIELLRAMGDEQAAVNREREIALEQLPEELRALQEQIWAAQRAAEINRLRAGLEIDLLKAQEEGYAALNLERKRMLAEMPQEVRAMQERVWAAELQSQRNSMEIELLRALGQEQEAVNREREIALKQLAPELHALQKRIWAALDAKKAEDEAREAMEKLISELERFADAAQSLIDRIDADILDLRGGRSTEEAGERFRDAYAAAPRTAEDFDPEAAQRALDAAGEYHDALMADAREHQAASEALQNARDGLRDWVDGLDSASDAFSRARRRTANWEQYQTTLAAAQAGDVDAMGDLPGAADSYLESVKATSGNEIDYQREVARRRAEIEALANETDDPHLAALDDVIDKLIALRDDVADLQAIWAAEAQRLHDDLKENDDKNAEEIIEAVTDWELAIQDALDNLDVLMTIVMESDLPEDIKELVFGTIDTLERTIKFLVDDEDLTQELKDLALGVITETTATIQYIVEADDLTDDLKKIALGTLDDVALLIEFSVTDDELTDELREIALLGAETVVKTIQLIAESEISDELKEIALLQADDITRSMELILTSDISDDMKALALGNVEDFTVTIGLIASSDELDEDQKRVLFEQTGSYTALINSIDFDKAVEQDLKDFLFAPGDVLNRSIELALSGDLTEDEWGVLTTAQDDLIRTLDLAWADSEITSDERDQILKDTATLERIISLSFDKDSDGDTLSPYAELERLINLGWTEDGLTDVERLKLFKESDTLSRSVYMAWDESGELTTDEWDEIMQAEATISRLVKGALSPDGLSKDEWGEMNNALKVLSRDVLLSVDDEGIALKDWEKLNQTFVRLERDVEVNWSDMSDLSEDERNALLNQTDTIMKAVGLNFDLSSMGADEQDLLFKIFENADSLGNIDINLDGHIDWDEFSGAFSDLASDETLRSVFDSLQSGGTSLADILQDTQAGNKPKTAVEYLDAIHNAVAVESNSPMLQHLYNIKDLNLVGVAQRAHMITSLTSPSWDVSEAAWMAEMEDKYNRFHHMPAFAKGGIANSASVFGEAGPEAAVPLPDGRTIPVTISGQHMPPINLIAPEAGNGDELKAGLAELQRELHQLRTEQQRQHNASYRVQKDQLFIEERREERGMPPTRQGRDQRATQQPEKDTAE